MSRDIAMQSSDLGKFTLRNVVVIIIINVIVIALCVRLQFPSLVRR